MSKIAKFIKILIYLLPVTLFFSYYPLIRFGSNSSMNFEISLPIIWLVIFDLATFVGLIWLGVKQRAGVLSWKNNFTGISDRKFFIFAWFPSFATVSIFWSANPLRGILTAGMIWLVFFAVFSLIYIVPLLLDEEKISVDILTKTIFASTAIVCVFCFLQSILDTCGVSRDYTMLCAGCTYRSFGFPRPSGFVIEPQFMGNLLLAPTFLAYYLLIFKSKTTQKVKIKRSFLITLAIFFSVTLFFIFSRGAIYAFAIGLLILLVFALHQKNYQVWKMTILPVISFVIALILQGTFATLGPTTETFSSAITKSIHQLSLGIIDLRPANDVIEEIDVDVQETIDGETAEIVETIEDDVAIAPSFDGYVAESTDFRMTLNRSALEIWSSDARDFLIGTGLGSAGVEIYEHFPERVGTAKQIVQNQPLSLLLETGLIGILLIAFMLFVAFYHSEIWRDLILPLMMALILAYFVTLNFFAGLPNALQIYLMPPLIYQFYKRGQEKRLKA